MLQPQTSGRINPIIYIPQNENVSRCTPIVINTQEVVGFDSMANMILFCRRVYENFKILPTVLIIPTKSINSKKLGIKEGSFLIPIKSTFWAYKCFLFSPSGIRSADGRFKNKFSFCLLVTTHFCGYFKSLFENKNRKKKQGRKKKKHF